MDAETQTALRERLTEELWQKHDYRAGPGQWTYSDGFRNGARAALALLPPEPAAGQAQEPSEPYRGPYAGPTWCGKCRSWRHTWPCGRDACALDHFAPQPVPAQDGPEPSVANYQDWEPCPDCGRRRPVGQWCGWCHPSAPPSPAPVLPPHQDVETLARTIVDGVWPCITGPKYAHLSAGKRRSLAADAVLAALARRAPADQGQR